MTRRQLSTAIRLILLPVAVASCAAGPAAENADRTPSVQTGYRAGGNEPFWNLTLGETAMVFSVLGRDSVTAPRPEAESVDNGWRYAATVDGQAFTVLIDERPCSDSMSGMPFPHTVAVTLGSETFTGCGGDTISMLAGDEWTVHEIEGVAVAGSQPPTLQFTSDSALSGTGGCNRYRSTYEVSGEGIRIGPAAATRMACTDTAANEQETRFFSVLERISRFDVDEDGALTLFEGDRPVIVARR